MLRVAYVTRDSCGLGHAVRGMALVLAGRRGGIAVRAFGPPKDGNLPGYEGSMGWEADVRAWQPDLLLGDLRWTALLPLKDALGIPGWILLRRMPPDWLVDHYEFTIDRWERRISIEPAEDSAPGITHRVPPIVGPDRWRPVDGSEVRAGYSAWWESILYGWHDRVRWTTEGSPERQARIDAGGEMTENGADVLMAMIA